MKPNIFNFADYRKFIKKYYQAKKAENPHFSYQRFCEKVGFSNKGFIHNVIKGNKNLTWDNALKLSEGMALSPSESEYFRRLVKYNQAKSQSEKINLFKELQKVQPMTPHAKRVTIDQYSYYSNWYYCAIRSIVEMSPGKNNGDYYKWIAKNLYPQISHVNVRKSIKAMLNLGMIIEDEDGLLSAKDKHIQSKEKEEELKMAEVRKLALTDFYEQMLERAKNALKELPSDKRDFSGMTLNISPESYPKIRSEIYGMLDRVWKIADEDKISDRVYQLCFQLFPLSGSPIQKG
jgi:uncharacterized protein (TIGR02147 family)